VKFLYVGSTSTPIIGRCVMVSNRKKKL
jgi:hypothetical protein